MSVSPSQCPAPVAGGPGSRSASLDIARVRSRGNSSSGFVRAGTEPPTIIEGQPFLMKRDRPGEVSTSGWQLLHTT